jgi:hypothetical protein
MLVRQVAREFVFLLVFVVMLWSVGAFAQEPAQQTHIPDKARILQLEDDVIERERLILVLQEQILRLRKQQIEQEKAASEPDIVKRAGGVEGQGWDYRAGKLKPIEKKPQTDTKP